MPKMRWNPETGESKVFATVEDVPEGWLDHHPEDPAYADATAEKATPAAKGLSKSETIAALKQGGVTHDPKATLPELTELLVTALRGALDAKGVEYTPEATARELLILVAS